jgi:hypothetical protein
VATPSEKTRSISGTSTQLQAANGAGAIRARDLTRTHRDRLLKNGFLREEFNLSQDKRIPEI